MADIDELFGNNGDDENERRDDYDANEDGRDAGNLSNEELSSEDREDYHGSQHSGRDNRPGRSNNPLDVSMHSEQEDNEHSDAEQHSSSEGLREEEDDEGPHSLPSEPCSPRSFASSPRSDVGSAHSGAASPRLGGSCARSDPGSPQSGPGLHEEQPNSATKVRLRKIVPCHRSYTTARLSTETRHEVVLLHQQGLSQTKISKQTGVSRCAVQALLKKHKETGNVEDRRGSGRPRKLSAADEEHIRLISLKDRKMSSSASSELAETCGTQVHPSTVRRSLARSGIHGRVAAKKPYLGHGKNPEMAEMDFFGSDGDNENECQELGQHSGSNNRSKSSDNPSKASMQKTVSCRRPYTMARLSTETRHKIVVLRQQGLSQTKISKRYGISRCAVQALLKKHEETGNVEDRRRSGRPRKLSAADEEHIRLISLKDRKMSSSAIGSELAETCGTQVHPSTVRRSLARIRCRKMAAGSLD